MVRPAGLVLALALFTGCTDDGHSSADTATPPDVVAGAAEAATPPGGGTGRRHDCPSGQLASGTTDYAAPATGAASDRGVRIPPSRLAREWFNRQVQTPFWASAGPFTVEQIDTRTRRGQRKIRVDYRAADGRLIGALSILWNDRTGWRVGGWRACAGQAGAEPAATATAPGQVIYRAMFSPSITPPSLDCTGPAGRAGFDAGSQPPADPQSVAELADYWEAQQSARANPDWTDAAPPRRWYYYPRDPAVAERAAVDWVDDRGRVVLSLQLDRWDNSAAWHVGAWNSCIHGAGVV